jgi:hypothetical protein
VVKIHGQRGKFTTQQAMKAHGMNGTVAAFFF